MKQTQENFPKGNTRQRRSRLFRRNRREMIALAKMFAGDDAYHEMVRRKARSG